MRIDFGGASELLTDFMEGLMYFAVFSSFFLRLSIGALFL